MKCARDGAHMKFLQYCEIELDSNFNCAYIECRFLIMTVFVRFGASQNLALEDKYFQSSQLKIAERTHCESHR